MSDLEVFILLDNSQRVFRAGERIWGKVVVVVKRQMRIRGVYITVTGKAVISAKGVKNSKGRLEVSNEENYCDYTKFLWGRSFEKTQTVDDEALEVLEEGRHCFPFLYKLPESCPCSFRGKYGSVEYSLDCAVVDRENFRHEHSFPFIVMRDLDLTRYQTIQQAKIEKEMSFSKLHCISIGVLDCRIIIAKRAFVPGEKVKIDVEIENRTGKKIRDISIVLKQNTIYRLEDGSILSDERSVYDFNFGTVRESTTTHWKDHQFKIPVLPPSNLEGCSLIDIIYIMALIRVKKPSVPLVSTHLTIGTTPSTGSKTHMRWKYSEPCFLPPGIRQRSNSIIPVYKVFYGEHLSIFPNNTTPRIVMNRQENDDSNV